MTISSLTERNKADSFPVTVYKGMTLLQTKLHPPNLPPSYQTRPQLLTRLNEGMAGKLTLVIAPAGSGKTTLLTAWATANLDRCAWVSLSALENNPASFWRAISAALGMILPANSEIPSLNSLLYQKSSQQIPLLLLNILNQVEESVCFVLDDYHLTDDIAIQQGMAVFIENLPAQHHLILSSRQWPKLPLPRLRVRRHLYEIIDADLRFTSTETAVFLQKNLSDNISSDLVDTLHKRTEGWVAGLVMATLACRHKPRPNQWLKDFNSTHRYLADYFLTELFQQQTAETQMFLLQTSILEQLHADCCVAVTGYENARQHLHHITDANLLLTPLDDARIWYRYHHLFGEWLQQRLQDDYPPTEIDSLHRRASQWYAAQSLPDEAIHHAFAANDMSYAAQLLEKTALANLWDRNYRVDLEKLPVPEVESRPRLCLLSAWWDAQQGERYLKLAESQLCPDDPDFSVLTGLIAARRAMLLRLHGEHKTASALAETALTLLPCTSLSEQRVVQQNLAIIYITNLQLDQAFTLLCRLYDTSQRQNDLITQIVTTYFLARIEILYGRLPAARQRCLQILEGGNLADPILGLLHLCLGEIYLEWYELEKAGIHFTQALTSGEQIQMIEIVRPALSGQMMLYHTLEQKENAQFSSNRLRQISKEVSFPLVQAEIALTLTEFALLNSDWATVDSWIQENNFKLTDRPDPPLIPCYLLLARTHIQRRLMGETSVGSPEIISLLNHLLLLSQQGRCIDYQIKIHLAKSLAYRSTYDMEAAQTNLRLAQDLAEQGKYQRLFLDHQYPILPAPDPLTPREKEILALVEKGFSTKAIATQLSLTTGTVKWHLGNVYQKLGVRSRTQAISRARSLGILKP